MSIWPWRWKIDWCSIDVYLLHDTLLVTPYLCISSLNWVVWNCWILIDITSTLSEYRALKIEDKLVHHCCLSPPCFTLSKSLPLYFLPELSRMKLLDPYVDHINTKRVSDLEDRRYIGAPLLFISSMFTLSNSIPLYLLLELSRMKMLDPYVDHIITKKMLDPYWDHINNKWVSGPEDGR